MKNLQFNTLSYPAPISYWYQITIVNKKCNYFDSFYYMMKSLCIRLLAYLNYNLLYQKDVNINII